MHIVMHNSVQTCRSHSLCTYQYDKCILRCACAALVAMIDGIIVLLELNLVKFNIFLLYVPIYLKKRSQCWTLSDYKLESSNDTWIFILGNELSLHPPFNVSNLNFITSISLLTPLKAVKSVKASQKKAKKISYSKNKLQITHNQIIFFLIYYNCLF